MKRLQERFPFDAPAGYSVPRVITALLEHSLDPLAVAQDLWEKLGHRSRDQAWQCVLGIYRCGIGGQGRGLTLSQKKKRRRKKKKKKKKNPRLQITTKTSSRSSSPETAPRASSPEPIHLNAKVDYITDWPSDFAPYKEDMPFRDTLEVTRIIPFVDSGSVLQRLSLFSGGLIGDLEEPERLRDRTRQEPWERDPDGEAAKGCV